MAGEKLLIKKTMFFLALLIITIYILNILYFSFVIPQKNIYRVDYQFKQTYEKKLPLILFFGDSHVIMSTNPEYIEDSFNYAVPGETYDKIFYKANKILNDYDSIRVFVLPLDVHSFSMNRGDPPKDVWFWKDFMTFDELSKVYGQSKLELLFKSELPVFGNGKDFLTLLFSQQRTIIINGWEKSEVRFNESQNLDALGRSDAYDHVKFYPESFSEEYLSYAQRIINIVEEKNKTVVFVKYPLTKEYIEGLLVKGFDLDKFYENLTLRLNNTGKLIVLDYQELIKDKPELFSDSHHLNMYGAEILSKRINEDLLMILPREERPKNFPIVLN